MSGHERTLAMIQAFYDAALDESLWPAALKNLSELTGSQAASFWVLGGSEQPRHPTFIGFNFDLEIIQEYLDHVAASDPTVRYLFAHPRQSIVHDGLVISESEKSRHPYYDWHNRNVETRFRMVGQTNLAPAVQGGVALHRTAKAGRYEPKDINRFAVLHGHLERALAIAFRLGSLGTMQQLTTEWLDRSTAAVFFLDDRRRVIFANRAAQKLRAEGDGIRLRADGVVLQSKADNDLLQTLVAQVLSPVQFAGAAPGGMMLAVRPSGKRPYGVQVGPVSGKYPALSGFRPAVCVVVTDPDRPEPPLEEKLWAVFGLTAAEARLGTMLIAGEELRGAAERLKITYGTARTRLAAIFQKTETRRQGPTDPAPAKDAFHGITPPIRSNHAAGSTRHFDWLSRQALRRFPKNLTRHLSFDTCRSEAHLAGCAASPHLQNFSPNGKSGERRGAVVPALRFCSASISKQGERPVMRILRPCVLTLLAALVCFVSSVSAQQYTVTNLGNLSGFTFPAPHSINNLGQVAGGTATFGFLGNPSISHRRQQPD